MSRRRAAWTLWAAALLLVPLPYFIVAEGSVPVIRFAIISSVATAYAVLVDGSGVAWPLAVILLLHVLVWAVALGIGAAVLARVLPDALRGRAVVLLIAAGFVLALVSDVYRTPFDDVRLNSTWTGLFQ